MIETTGCMRIQDPIHRERHKVSNSKNGGVSEEETETAEAEVQKLTGWTATAIKVRAFRARQKLRKQIGGLL